LVDDVVGGEELREFPEQGFECIVGVFTPLAAGVARPEAGVQVRVQLLVDAAELPDQKGLWSAGTYDDPSVGIVTVDSSRAVVRDRVAEVALGLEDVRAENGLRVEEGVIASP